MAEKHVMLCKVVYIFVQNLEYSSLAYDAMKTVILLHENYELMYQILLYILMIIYI